MATSLGWALTRKLQWHSNCHLILKILTSCISVDNNNNKYHLFTKAYIVSPQFGVPRIIILLSLIWRIEHLQATYKKYFKVLTCPNFWVFGGFFTGRDKFRKYWWEDNSFPFFIFIGTVASPGKIYIAADKQIICSFEVSLVEAALALLATYYVFMYNDNDNESV